MRGVLTLRAGVALLAVSLTVLRAGEPTPAPAREAATPPPAPAAPPELAAPGSPAPPPEAPALKAHVPEAPALGRPASLERPATEPGGPDRGPSRYSLPVGAQTASAQRAFDEGNRAFEEARAYASDRPADRDGMARRYRAAAELFVAAWKAGAASSAVFTNAGNAYAFAGDVGPAVLFYRRALAVDPTNDSARRSLDHLRLSLPVRKPEASAGVSIVRSLFFWHEFPFWVRRVTLMAAFPAAFACLVVALRRRRPFLLAGLLLLGASAALLTSLLVDALGGSLRGAAVVMTQVEGRLGNGLNYSPSHSRPFPPGTEVEVEETRTPEGGGEAWLRVRLLDGKTSWIPAGVVERVLQ